MMSTKELARLTVIKGAIDGVYTVKQAARKLGMSTRWVKHLKRAVREQGDGAVIHGNAGRHELGVNIVYVRGDPKDKVNKGFRIWYRVLASGEAAPADPEELTKSFYTKRKKDAIEFAYNDSGKVVYFAIQIENEDKKGPWGPLVSAIIP